MHLKNTSVFAFFLGLNNPFNVADSVSLSLELGRRRWRSFLFQSSTTLTATSSTSVSSTSLIYRYCCLTQIAPSIQLVTHMMSLMNCIDLNFLLNRDLMSSYYFFLFSLNQKNYENHSKNVNSRNQLTRKKIDGNWRCLGCQFLFQTIINVHFLGYVSLVISDHN